MTGVMEVRPLTVTVVTSWSRAEWVTEVTFSRTGYPIAVRLTFVPPAGPVRDRERRAREDRNLAILGDGVGDSLTAYFRVGRGPRELLAEWASIAGTAAATLHGAVCHRIVRLLDEDAQAIRDALDARPDISTAEEVQP